MAKITKFQAEEAYKAMLAASEQDQPKAAAGQVSSHKDTDEAGGAVNPASAAAPDLLRGIALGIEAAAKECQREWQGANALYKSRVAGELMRSIRSLNPADIAAKNPTEQPTGADWKAARERVLEKHPNARTHRNLTEDGFSVWTEWGTRPLGSGPTEEAAWIDAARWV